LPHPNLKGYILKDGGGEIVFNVLLSELKSESGLYVLGKGMARIT
jgi:hypothetical protein